MAQTIKLKRSSVAGRAPTVNDLELGEVAINTYDGKMYIKKDVSGTASIVEIGSATEAQTAVWKEYAYTATSGQTTFSGTDDNSETLTYLPGFIQVFLNGVLLDPATDYTATSGASVVLTSGAALNDLLQIASFVKVIGSGDLVTDEFTGDNSTVAFTLSANPDNENNTLVFIDGVYQEKATYSVSGTTLTFSTAPYTGASIEVIIASRNVTVQNVDGLTVNSIQFNTDQTGSTAVGEVAWNTDTDTLELGLNANVNLEVGEQNYFQVKAAESISKGDVLYASGAVGNSSKVEVSKYIANNTIEEQRIIGLAAQDMALNDFGFAISFGTLRGLQTNGQNLTTPETWVLGDILYASAAVAGELTRTRPAAPNQAVPIAFVTSVNSSAGSLVVRAYELGSHLDEIHDVEITSVADNDLLQWNTSASRWENVAGTTSNIAEGTNLYWTTARGDSNFSTNLAASDTDDLSEGATNLYYTSARANADFDTRLATKSTTDLAEGTNLYYTDARVDSRLSSGSVATISTSGDVTVGGNLTVNGTTTTINSTTLDIDDVNITLASGAANAAAADGAGITVDGASATLTYNSTPDAWSFNKSVGIGTASPSEKLEVSGAIKSTSNASNFQTESQLTLDYYDAASAGRIAAYKSTGSSLAFFTNASGGNTTEHLTISSSGYVGVGTSSPSAKLHVNAGEIRIASSATYNTHFNYLDTGNNIISQADAGATEIRNTSSTLLYLTSGGRLGLGTTSPSEVVQINSADSAIRVNTTNAANNAELQLLYNNNLEHGMLFRYHGNSALGYIDNTYPRQSGYSYGDIIFRQNYAGTMTEHMRLTAYDGYLGLFTANPKARLELNLHSGAGSSLMNASSVNDVQLLRAGFGLNADTTSNAGAKWGLRFVGRNDGTYDNSKSAAVYAVSEDVLGYNREVGLAFHTSAFDANHAERMRIDSDGKVGIGTTAPGSTLHVDSSSGAVVRLTRLSANAGAYGQLEHDGTLLTVTSTGDTKFYNNAGESMRIDSSGKVLVGASSFATGLSPYAQFEVSGSNGGIVINSSSTGASDYSRLMFTKGNADGNEGLIRYNTNDYHMSFWTNATEQMRITSAGNVGIGTTSPNRKLDVDGVIGIRDGTLTGGGGVELSSLSGFGAAFQALNYKFMNATNSSEYMRINSNGYLFLGHTGHSWNTFHDVAQIGRTGAIANYDSGANQQTVITNNTYYSGGYKAITGDTAASYINLSQGDINFYTATTVTAGSAQTFNPVVVIKNDGKVGIGTTSPFSVLDVMGANDTTFDGVTTLALYGTNSYNSGDAGSGINFGGIYNSASDQTTFAQISGKKANATNGNFDGVLTFGVRSNAGGLNIERMRLDAGGRLMVGTTDATSGGFNPTILAKQIYDGGVAAGLNIEASGSDSVLGIGYNGNVWVIAPSYRTTAGYKPLTFHTNGSERMRIDTAGNIGIGTSSPTTKLNILGGTGTADGNVAFKIGGPSNYQTLEMGVGPGSYDGFIRSYGNDLHYYSGHFRTVGTTASENHQHFWYTSKTGSTDWSTWKMQLDENGDLTVNGTVEAENLIITDPATAPVKQRFSILPTSVTISAGSQVVCTAAITVTLPASPTAGDSVVISNQSAGTVTVGRNGSNINSTADDGSLAAGVSVQLVYVNSTIGWADL